VYRRAEEPIASQATPGTVHLTVADLERSRDFYEEVVGLAPAQPPVDGVLRLGAAGRELLALYEQPGAKPVSGHTGLFHFALLLPTRLELARWLHHAAAVQAPLTGLSDHYVSEAIYLRDPDGHGIEIYADRPRQTWSFGPDGSLHMGTIPLDTRSLLGQLGPEPPEPYGRMPEGTVMGHVHLHVADLRDTETFYGEVLGFDITVRLPGAATFLSARGYHHHLGANIWAGRGATPPPPGSAALRHATIVLPDDAEVQRLAGRVADTGQDPVPTDDGVMVRDPSQNGLLLTT